MRIGSTHRLDKKVYWNWAHGKSYILKGLFIDKKHSFIDFHDIFSLGRVEEEAALGGLEVPYGQQQSLATNNNFHLLRSSKIQPNNMLETNAKFHERFDLI